MRLTSFLRGFSQTVRRGVESVAGRVADLPCPRCLLALGVGLALILTIVGAIAGVQALLAALIVIVGLAILGAAVFVLPGRLVADLPDLGSPPPDDHITLKDQQTIRGDREKRLNDLRIGLLQAIAGLAVLVTLLTTLLQLQATQKQTTDQLDLTRRGQIADRFTKAIDQLGQPGPDKLDVRLGGIYGLEQIARDARDDRTRLAAYEVLTAYVRGHAIWNPSASVDLDTDLQTRAPDIQAVVTVLARRDPANSDPPIDLHGADLRVAILASALLDRANLRAAHLDRALLASAHLERALLVGAHLDHALLASAHLERADLGDAYLEGAYLASARLESADLDSAYLEFAQLSFAHLDRANLHAAHLKGADLSSAHLERAELFQADLQGADLRGAHLEGAELMQAHLGGALADGKTTWPNRFDWKAAGVRMES